jgi:hypothetical protein
VDTVQSKPAGTAPRMARRAVLAAGTLGLCGAVAAAPYVGQRLQEAERAALLAELAHVEGISLNAAIQAAELTRAAVETIVLPLARFVATVGNGALGLLLAAIDAARAALAVVHAPTTILDQFRAVVASWQAGVTILPIALDAYLTADITSAESYLRALKRMMEREQAAQIHL